MNVVNELRQQAVKAVNDLYNVALQPEAVQITETKPEFTGDYTVVLFSLLKQLKGGPEVIGAALGAHLVQSNPGFITAYDVVKGFLNLTVADGRLLSFLKPHTTETAATEGGRQKIIVEYASPNTNKPLHLGHLRNIFLGWSVSEILTAAGHHVIKTCIVNDRGIHICKSMLAWQKFGNGATPESTGIKGDHLVGDYYVKFNDVYKAEVQVLIDGGMQKAEAEKQAPLMQQTQAMLVDWENGVPGVMDLWRRMNGWVYKGFDETYTRIGSDFQKTYYESETYLLGKRFVENGLQTGVLFKKDDGSVWIDLAPAGLDEKLLLRGDGTSVYMTQDLGLAQQKFEDYAYDQSIYVIGDEQNYHMKVLKLILQKTCAPYAGGIYHLSYGMVELPGGRMKSREGTVVDADDILDEMVREAEKKTAEHSDISSFTKAELAALYEMIGIGALKFFLLRVDPKKKMIFNPEESIDFHGFTGPFVQYTHARIKSILRKIGQTQISETTTQSLLPLEKKLLLLLEQYQSVVETAARDHNPSGIANYVFNLAKMFNGFYAEHAVLRAESEDKKALRVLLCARTAETLKNGMHLLGIQVPERM